MPPSMKMPEPNGGQIGFTSDLKIAAASHRAAEALGLEAEAMLGQSVDLVDPAEGSALKDALVRAFSEGPEAAGIFRCRLRRADGNQLPVVARLTMEEAADVHIAVLRFSSPLEGAARPLSDEEAGERRLAAAGHLGACDTLEEAAAVLIDAAEALLPACDGALYLAEGPELLRAAGWGIGGSDPFPTSGLLEAIWAVRLGQAHLAEVRRSRLGGIPGLKADGWAGTAPMLARGRTVGLICAVWTDEAQARREMPRLASLAETAKHTFARLADRG